MLFFFACVLVFYSIVPELQFGDANIKARLYLKTNLQSQLSNNITPIQIKSLVKSSIEQHIFDKIYFLFTNCNLLGHNCEKYTFFACILE